MQGSHQRTRVAKGQQQVRFLLFQPEGTTGAKVGAPLPPIRLRSRQPISGKRVKESWSDRLSAELRMDEINAFPFRARQSHHVGDKEHAQT